MKESGEQQRFVLAETKCSLAGAGAGSEAAPAILVFLPSFDEIMQLRERLRLCASSEPLPHPPQSPSGSASAAVTGTRSSSPATASACSLFKAYLFVLILVFVLLRVRVRVRVLLFVVCFRAHPGRVHIRVQFNISILYFVRVQLYICTLCCTLSLY